MKARVGQVVSEHRCPACRTRTLVAASVDPEIRDCCSTCQRAVTRPTGRVAVLGTGRALPAGFRPNRRALRDVLGARDKP